MARLSFASFAIGQWRTSRAVAKANLAGKTVIVVGANAGLGFEATCHFARMGPGRLILACRNAEKGAAALTKLEQVTGYKSAELWMIDLSRFSSVREFVDRFEREGDRLDLLVANAAMATLEYETTSDGWETTLQVNDLAISLLTLLLLPHMIQTARDHSTIPRIVVVSSEVHFWASIEQSVIGGGNIFQTLSSREYCTSAIIEGRYHVSKLLNILFVRELNARLSRSQHPDSIVVNTVNPGFCHSELRKDIANLWTHVMEILFAIPAEQGSRQLVWGAVGDAGNEEKLRGAYISRSEVEEVSDFILSEAGRMAQVRLWDDMIATLAKIDFRVQAVSDSLLAPAS